MIVSLCLCLSFWLGVGMILGSAVGKTAGIITTLGALIGIFIYTRMNA